MLRFAFKPRHPVTRVAFTADGREVVTAQPHTGIAVRDRLTGAARQTFPIPRAAEISELAVHQTDGWIGVVASDGVYMYGPRWPDGGGQGVGSGDSSFGTTAGSPPRVSWTTNYPPLYWTWDFAPPSADGIRFAVRHTTTIRTVGQMVAVSPDAAFALCLRPHTRPILAEIATGELVAELPAPIRLRHSAGCVITFSPDGTKLALGEGETLTLFDLAGVPRIGDGSRRVMNPLFTLERPDPTAHGTQADKQSALWLPPVAFDHAGRSLFTLGLRNRVRRIDLSTGGVMNEWGWRCEPIRSLAVAPDDLTAAAGCTRGEVVLWDLE